MQSSLRRNYWRSSEERQLYVLGWIALGDVITSHVAQIRLYRMSRLLTQISLQCIAERTSLYY